MVTVHGRTREQGYQGAAEYDTIAAVKAAVRIPVVANGDIDSPAKARAVLAATGADALMIGRAAQGRPWIFREIAHYLATGEALRAADGRRGARLAARAPARPLRVCTARQPACAARASTSAGRCASCPAARRSARSMNLLDDCAGADGTPSPTGSTRWPTRHAAAAAARDARHTTSG